MQDYRQHFLILFTNCTCKIYINKKAGKKIPDLQVTSPGNSMLMLFHHFFLKAHHVASPQDPLLPLELCG